MSHVLGRRLREFYDGVAPGKDEQEILEKLTAILGDLGDQCELGIFKDAKAPTIKVNATRPPQLLLLAWLAACLLRLTGWLAERAAWHC